MRTPRRRRRAGDGRSGRDASRCSTRRRCPPRRRRPNRSSGRRRANGPLRPRVLSVGDTILHVSDVHAPSLDPSFDLEDVSFGEAGRDESVVVELWTRVPGETAWSLLLRADLHLGSLYGIGDDLVRASPSLGSDAIVIGLRSGEFIAAPPRVPATSELPPPSFGARDRTADDGEVVTTTLDDGPDRATFSRCHRGQSQTSAAPSLVATYLLEVWGLGLGPGLSR